jgi:hypothetical protein
MACLLKNHTKQRHKQRETIEPMITAPIPDSADPMPQPPEQPDLDACCGNGCDPCIFDSYDLAMDEYRQALRAWKARNETPAGQG